MRVGGLRQRQFSLHLSIFHFISKVLAMHAIPYWRLSAFYFAYFAFVGAFTPFWSLYLQSLAFAPLQIAVLMSLFQVARIFSPGLWGWLADHLGRRVPLIQWLTSLSLLAFVGVFFGHTFWWMFAVMLLLSFFWSASLPLIETVTLGHLGDRFDRYGRIRMWGSIGFIAAVIGLGYLLDYRTIQALLWVVFALLVAVALFSRNLSEPLPVLHAQDIRSLWQIISQRQVIALMVACFAMSAAHGAYYTFYSIYLVDHGYSKSQVGWLWGVGVLCEILIFLWMPALSKQFGLQRILMASLFLGFVRFLLIAWAIDYWWLILFAQVLHAATFGAYHASAVALTYRYFKGKHQSKGQGLYTSMSYGVGGSVGAVLSGSTWQSMGPHWTFTLAALCAMLGCVLYLGMQRH